MILRLRSPLGQSRLDVQPTLDAADFHAKVSQELKLAADSFFLSVDPQGKQALNVQAGRVLSQLNLKHGDMIYVNLLESAKAAMEASNPAPAAVSSRISPLLVKQHPVDNGLEKLDGSIKRTRDPRFCKHGDQGMCEYCTALPPYDAKYLEENKIKHMSFHAYLKQLMDSNKTHPITSPEFLPPLEDLNFKVVEPCPGKSHGKYPEGICTKCQPSAITLSSQNFRMVDHIEFESPALIDTFLQAWRASGCQRAGYLFGRYEPYTEVPLGVKAVVSTIYEPLQQGSHDTIQLAIPDPGENTVKSLAADLGLELLGIVYTDLWDDGTGKGTVVCKRHADSYFLSSAECMFAAQCQLANPVSSRYASSADHRFGSRFVTCVLSGNAEGGIDIFSYQVSIPCETMVRDHIIEASVEPSLMRVRASSNEQYIPEVFFKYKNKYNIMVKEAARPTFPVEYLLVTVTHGFPSNPQPTFDHSQSFPIENRVGFDKTQDMSAFKKLIDTGLPLATVLTNFHVLYFLQQAGVLDQDAWNLLVQAIRERSDYKLRTLVQTGAWQTLLMILQESAGSGAGNAGTSGSSSGAGRRTEPWPCRHCTFVNPAGNDSCEMCGLPPDQ